MKTNTPLLPVAVSVAVFLVSCTSKTTIIWNEGVPAPETGVAVHELLVCNAPEGVEWDLWGHFYDGCKLPCKAVEGSMAQMYMYSGSCWRIEPTQPDDTVVLKYIDVRRKHSWFPRGFYIRMRESGKVIPVPVKINCVPFDEPVYPEFPLVAVDETDIVPAVKSVVKGEGSSKIVVVEESIVEGIRPEGYRLIIKDDKALIEASDIQGLRHGHITLDKFKENVGSDTLPDMTVEDWPDFAYRAQMIDVARLYYPLDELKKLVDVLERCKMNVLALHLNDDESWRLEIDGLPELTSFGGFHDVPVRLEDGTYQCGAAVPPVKGSAIGKVWAGTSGYYSRADYIDFLKYAQAHGVTVIPEIDIPGHCYSAIEAMKYRERTTGDTSCRLVHPDDASVYCSVQGYSGNVIDIALPSVYTFLEKVFDSIISMYAEAGVPLNEIAVGGDEVAEGAWEGSPSCIQAMKEMGLANIGQLREAFILNVNAMLREKGMRISGYNEMVQHLSDEGFAEIADNCGCIWVWKPVHSTTEGTLAYDLANRGMKVALAQAGHLYFDNARTMQWADRGLYWAGTTDDMKVYTFLPYNIGASHRFDINGNPVDIVKYSSQFPELKCPENIIGIQGMLWGDNLWESQDGFSMLFPKAYGAWERNWNACPSWEQSEDPEDPAFMEDFIRFYTVVRQRELPHLDKVGLKYWRQGR